MGSLSLAPIRKHQRKERYLLFTSDDNAMLKQVQATHAPDGREVDVYPIIKIVEEMLNLIDQLIGPRADEEKHKEETSETTAILAEMDVFDSLTLIIHKISLELQIKCIVGADPHATTMELLNSLSNYSWQAKVALTLAGFAIVFGEFWFITHMSLEKALAKCVAFLKQLPGVSDISDSLKPQVDALNNLVKAAIEVTRCIVEFKNLPSEYVSEDTPPFSVVSNQIPIAAYWIMRSVVACATQIFVLIGMINESMSSASGTWELSGLVQKVNSIYEQLKNKLAICYEYIDDKRQTEAFDYLISLFKSIHVDNMKILKALIYARDDIPPLIDGTTKSKVSIDVLRRKHVLLLISDLDLSQEEIMILDNLYKDAKSRGDTHYEIVWIPVVDKATWNDAHKLKFEYLQSLMAWYSVRDPFIIEQYVIRYIREVWNFTKQTILVALDPLGKLSSTNALHMYWIWGNLAFPFTNEKEESLWKQEIWSLELLVDGIDPLIFEWMTEGKFICLYGGENLEWIETFTTTAMNAAKRSGKFELEMVYVGKSNAKQRMQRMINTFATKKFSHYWPNVTSIWFFWARLESMLYSKLQHGKTIENDHIMSEVMTVLSFDGSDQEWAIFCKGTSEITSAKGDTALTSFRDFDKWKDNIEIDGLVPALKDYLQQLYTPHHCNRLILPGSTGGIPQMVVCAECGRQMEKYFMYRCCVE